MTDHCASGAAGQNRQLDVLTLDCGFLRDAQIGQPLFNVGADGLRMILLKVMSTWNKMHDAAVPEPLRELFSECWRDQYTWISHEK